MPLAITVYDGANCIGGNKIYLSDGKDGLFLDFGKNFGKYGRFYEEFLKSRPTRGIHDLLALGLIPKLDIYRPDLLTPDVSVAGYPRLPVSAVLLSHAHLDHCGNIGLLPQAVPVFSTPMTAAILKGYQDAGKSTTEGDVVYSSGRRPSDDDPLYLESDTKGCYLGREFCFPQPPPEEFLKFFTWKPGQDSPRARKKLAPGRCCTMGDHPLPFGVSAYDVDHSLYGACGFIIEGGKTVVYTGDFRLHGRGEAKTREFIRRAKGADVLITEGTRVSDPGPADGGRVTEDSVCETCRGAVEGYTGLVIADFSARNFERLEAFRDIAARTGRELVVTARDLYMLYALFTVDGVKRWEGIRVYDEITDHDSRKWEIELVKKLAGDRYVKHDAIRADPGRFILCFSFFDMNHLLDIMPAGGRYLYSSCEPFSEEMEIDFRRLWEWLQYFHIEPCGFSMKKNEAGDLVPSMDKNYHASGHASGADVLWAVGEIDPGAIIPVHTEHPEWFAKNFDGVRLPVEGERILF
ncbi:MAG TPA: MBL fold metallo-hydrolase [Methanomicrobiales archaeon]|nr:MBL fold metallo-hydrolase [Methanomicrobiales archaeon]